jgi:hypothetical protein
VAIVEVNRAVAETAFVQQLEVHANVVAGEGTFAASHDDGHEEQLVLVDQTGLDRPGRKLGTTTVRSQPAAAFICRTA